ncbi:MAG: ABC transporter protein, partial [uncultured Thermomicrobiales bacterium]
GDQRDRRAGLRRHNAGRDRPLDGAGAATGVLGRPLGGGDPGDPGVAAGTGDGNPVLDHPGLLFRGQHRHPGGFCRARDLRSQLPRLPTADGDRLRDHRRVPGAGPGHRHPVRLLRPPADDADAAPLLAARPDGRRPGAGPGAGVPGGAAGIGGRGPVRDRRPRGAAVHGPGRSVGSGLHRLPVRDRAQDGVAGGGRGQLHPLLPVRLPDHGDAAAGAVDRLAGDHRPLQPDDLPPGGAALAPLRRLAAAGAAGRLSRGDR